MSDAFKARTLKRKNVKGLALNAAPPKSTSPSATDSQIPGGLGNDEGTHDTLEIGVEFMLDLRSEDIIVLKELGAGNGGTVSKVQHAATKVVMARKVIHVEAKKEVRKQIVRELHIMRECNSPFIVSFYGAFLNEAGDVIMCMEYMDCGSLDRISKDFGPVRVDVLGKIAEAILGGLTYLYNVHRIMHRDIKPSNILVNSRGCIKLCDFGVSGQLVNSVADTFVGTSTYMAPERIQGAKYSVKSDVWSVALTLMELAIGRFPFDANDSTAGDRASAGPMGILDLLQQIVHEPAPKLPKSDAFPSILEEMIEKCLVKDPGLRPTPQQLFDNDPFIQAAKRTPVDLQGWAVSLMEKHNRISHLAPQLSPSTQSLLRDATPTSGEIPIVGEVKAYPPSSGLRKTPPNGSAGGYSPYSSHPPRTSSSSTLPSQARGLPSARELSLRDLSLRDLPIRGSSSRTSESTPPAPPPAGPLPPPPVGLNGRAITPKKPSDAEVKKDLRRQGTTGNSYATYEAPQY
ncbi:MAG: MAP kinase kinase (MEK) [Geoglossum umbratile]|nr:MAG: MAP kinase kinase (MEK) [Geoglossum umbratile]